MSEERANIAREQNTDSNSIEWEYLNDILVRIFETFDIYERISGIAHVCRAWRNAACDPYLWTRLDLSMLKSNFIKIPLAPYVYVDGQSDKTLTRVLKISLNLSQGNIQTLIFHYNLYISDDQLTYTAERCPQLKRLVMPGWNRIRRSGICQAIRSWPKLESLTMPSISSPGYLLEEIGNHCKNFSELKVMFMDNQCDMNFASAVATCLPNLKVLSISCSMLHKDALIKILEDAKELKVLNISHCMLVEVPPRPAPKIVLKEFDDSILSRARRLRRFVTCISDSCIMCQRTRNDEGMIRWYKYEKDMWKADEVSSLAV